MVMVLCTGSIYTVVAAVNSLAQQFPVITKRKLIVAALMCVACGASCMCVVTSTSYPVLFLWNYKMRGFVKFGVNFLAAVSMIYIYSTGKLATDYKFMYNVDLHRLFLFTWQLVPFAIVVSKTIWSFFYSKFYGTYPEGVY